MTKINNLNLYSPNNRLLLENLSFSIVPKRKLVFSGPNGCGKSTLLRFLAGLEIQPNVGKFATFLDEAVYLPTRPLDLLLPWATVTENINFFNMLATNRKCRLEVGMPADSGRSLGYCLEEYWGHYVYKLSSGQQALLAIYCALLQNAPVLIADEIFSTLSEQLRKTVANFLAALGMTIICASHDSEFSKNLGADIYELDLHIPINGIFL